MRAVSRTPKTRPVSAARQPLVSALAAARSASLSTWQNAEAGFLAAMQTFDEMVANGRLHKVTARTAKATTSTTC